MKLRLILIFVAAFNLAYSQNKRNPAIIDAKDPFTPYLTEEAPKIIKDLGEETDSIKLKKVVFHSRDVNANGTIIPTEVFTAIARPLKPGNYPGILVLHGGGGAAEIDRIRKWAAKGYIAVSIDLPGITAPEKVPNSTGHWKTYAYGKNRFTVSPDITNSTIFEGVVSAIQALYLLRSQPDVIKDRIGITGISWGGYMTTIVSGLANADVHASFSTYGAGFYDTASTFLKELDKMSDSDRALWLKYLDAGRRARYITTPFFIGAASNDNWFYPPAVMATLMAIKGPVNHFFAPNANHSAGIPGGNGSANRVGSLQMEETYFNFYLKGLGLPLPQILKAEGTADKGTGSYNAKFTVSSKTKITAATIYYSTDSLWTKRKWIAVKATTLDNLNYKAQIPAEAIAKGTWWYASISDGRPVTVSSNVLEIK